MRRALRITAFVFAGLVAITAATLWSWTRTPYGPMDVGAAIVIRSMPSGPM